MALNSRLAKWLNQGQKGSHDKVACRPAALFSRRLFAAGDRSYSWLHNNPPTRRGHSTKLITGSLVEYSVWRLIVIILYQRQTGTSHEDRYGTTTTCLFQLSSLRTSKRLNIVPHYQLRTRAKIVGARHRFKPTYSRADTYTRAHGLQLNARDEPLATAATIVTADTQTGRSADANSSYFIYTCSCR